MIRKCGSRDVGSVHTRKKRGIVGKVRVEVVEPMVEYQLFLLDRVRAVVSSSLGIRA